VRCGVCVAEGLSDEVGCVGIVCVRGGSSDEVVCVEVLCRGGVEKVGSKKDRS
jgi:hypothetical protein